MFLTGTARRPFAALLGVGAGALLMTAAPAAASDPVPVPSPTPPAAGGAPWTVPAMQQWHPGGHAFDLPNASLRVNVLRSDARALGADAETFADDLAALTGRHVVVDTNWQPLPPAAGQGQTPSAIDLGLDPAITGHGDEQYRITVDGDATISAATRAGVWDGTRTVLQLLHQSDRIPGGVADDWPAYPERSLMIDNGRKYMTPAWAEREIRELSYLKYNQFHWHITDNSGFRIEVKSHPEIVSPDHWSQQQVRDLIGYAAKYHIEVIPEIDMPGHMQYALRTHPELQIVDANGNRNASNLDPTNPAARAFVKDILDELIPLFPGRYIGTGGDEFTSNWNAYPVLTQWAQQKYGPQANSHDAVLDFTNYLDSIIRAHGKTMRIWNDGAQGGSQVAANKDIVLEYWSSQHGGELAQQFLDDGYRLVNADRNVLYDVPGNAASYDNTDPREIFEQWDMTKWMDWIGPNTTAAGAPGVLGGQLHIWNDTPTAATEDQEAERIEMPLRAMIQQLWGSPLADHSWNSFVAMAFAVGHEPQWQRPDTASQDAALGALAWSSSRERPDCHESALVDGDDSTRWCGPKTAPQSVVIDLGRPVDLGTVVLHWEAAFASGYSLDVSNDLRTWTPLYTTDHGTGGVEVLPVSGTGRYLRLAMTTRGTQYGYSLYEIRAYPAGALVPTQFSAATNPQSVLAPAGSPGTSTLTVRNTSDEPVTARWSANPPAGVTVTPAAGTLQVPAHGSAAAEVQVEAGTQPGNATVPITVTAESLGQQVTLAQTSLLVSVPYAHLNDAYNNVAVTSDADIAPAGLGSGFDGAGSSYSAEALAGAGITPGATLTAGGDTVHWPDVSAAQPDNVVANGQSINLPGAGHTIGVIAAASYGPAKGSWVVHYADGTSDTVSMATPDWSATPPAGSTALASMTYHNSSASGHVVRRTYVFEQSLPVDPAKTVVAVTLPAIGATAVRGAPALHVFDLSLN
jgi:hexosaminidase